MSEYRNNVVNLFTGEPVEVPAAETSEYIAVLCQEGLPEFVNLVQEMTDAPTEQEFRALARQAKALLDSWNA